MQIVETTRDLRDVLDAARATGRTVGLVPTMGALHAGHHALVQLARRRAGRVTVSIFVNPTQFAPNEDLAIYPRTFAADVAALGDGGADLVWAPSTAIMYPDGFATRIVPQGPAPASLRGGGAGRRGAGPRVVFGLPGAVAGVFVGDE